MLDVPGSLDPGSSRIFGGNEASRKYVGACLIRYRQDLHAGCFIGYACARFFMVYFVSTLNPLHRSKVDVILDHT